MYNLANGTDLAASQHYQNHVVLFHSLARALPAMLGALSVLLVYAIARLWSRPAALISSLFAALSFFLIENAHIIRPDIPQTFFLLSTIYCWLRIMQAPTMRYWYLLLGVSFGLAVNMKYPSLFFLVPLCVVLLYHVVQKRVSLRNWVGAATTALLTSFITGPFLYVDLPTVLSDLAKENRAVHAGHDGWNFLQNLSWYVFHVLSWQVGTVIYTAACCTVIVVVWHCIRRRMQQRDWMLLSLVIAAVSYPIMISALHLHWERWMIPVSTIFFIVAGIGLGTLLQRARRRKQQLACVLVIVLCLVAPTMRLLRTVYAFSHPHTSALARTWIEEHLPAGTHLVTEILTTTLPSDKYTILELPNLGLQTVREYRKQDITHFIIGERVYGALQTIDEEDGPAYENVRAVTQPRYEKLLSQGTLLKEVRANEEFTRDQLTYSHDLLVLRTPSIHLLMGPYIRIYALRPHIDGGDKN